MTNFILLLMLLYLITIFILTTVYSHLLITLMSLEILMLILMNTLYPILLIKNLEFFIMIYLLMIVCEGALGLSLLILLIQFKGSDKLNSMNLNLW